MGDDEYHPISMKGTNLTAAGGIGYTVIDSLDTMLIMGLTDEYSRARRWVDTKLSFDRDANFNTFEVDIVPSLLNLADQCYLDHHSRLGWPSLRISPLILSSPLIAFLAQPRTHVPSSRSSLP